MFRLVKNLNFGNRSKILESVIIVSELLVQNQIIRRKYDMTIKFIFTLALWHSFLLFENKNKLKWSNANVDVEILL